MKHQQTALRGNGQSHYNLSHDYHKIKSALASTRKNVKRKAYQSLRDLKMKSYDMQDDAAAYISKRPFKSLGIAVAAGIVLGYLFRK